MILKETQLKWLGEIYDDLGKIAQALLPESVTVAEDAVSAAMEKVLEAIQRGKVKANKKAIFCAYVRLSVRREAYTAGGRYEGDIRIDPAKATVSRQLRPATRRTSVVKVDIEEPFAPYDRTETVK